MNSYRDDEVNLELTKEIQTDKKYQVYLDWLKNNGALFENIEFPVAFGNSGYIGVAAKEKIPPNKVIVAIPNKLLLSAVNVESSDLKPVIKDNPLFENDQNKLALFLMTEKIKADKSFWAPYLNISPTQFNLLDWTDKEVENIGDPYLLQRFKQLKQFMEQMWKKFEIVIKNYSNIISDECCDQKLFQWSYQFIQTRCFPQGLLAPLADAFNHSIDGNRIFVFNKAYELKERFHKNYIIKNKEIDFSIFKHFNYKEDILKKIQNPPDLKKNYIYDNTEGGRDMKFLEDLERQQVEYNIRLINAKKLKSKTVNLWQMPYFTTSEDEVEDEEEEDKNNYTSILQKNNLFVQKNLRQNKEEDKFQQEFEDRKKYASEHRRKEKYKEHLIETKWDWFKSQDQDIYLTVSTSRQQPKGKQIYYGYGRFSNRYLMEQYGFCLENNYYDSYPFRIWLNGLIEIIDQADKDKLKNIISTDYLDESQNQIMWCGQKRSIEQFSNELKLKKSKLCLHFIDLLRIILLSGQDQSILETFPTSINLEKRVFELAYKILLALKEKVFNRSIEEDEKELQNPKLDYKKKFATVLKKEHKLIIQAQINSVELIRRILGGLSANKQITIAVSEKYDDIEPTEEDYQLNRERIRQYIHKLYIGVFKLNH